MLDALWKIVTSLSIQTHNFTVFNYVKKDEKIVIKTGNLLHDLWLLS